MYMYVTYVKYVLNTYIHLCIDSESTSMSSCLLSATQTGWQCQGLDFFVRESRNPTFCRNVCGMVRASAVTWHNCGRLAELACTGAPSAHLEEHFAGNWVMPRYNRRRTIPTSISVRDFKNSRTTSTKNRLCGYHKGHFLVGNATRGGKIMTSRKEGSRTKSFLEYWGCRTPQPGRTWLIGPGAVLVLVQNAGFVRDNVHNKQKEDTGVESLSKQASRGLKIKLEIGKTWRLWCKTSHLGAFGTTFGHVWAVRYEPIIFIPKLYLRYG